MQFRIGAIPKSEAGEPPVGWTPLREPGPALMQLFALPLGAIVCAIVAALWIYATPVTKNPVAYPVLLVSWLIALIPVHELLHAAVHPAFGLSRNSIIGLWPSRMLFYAHYDGIISRNRFIAVLAMPLLVITLGPLMYCIIAGHASVTLAFVSSLNALAAGGDIFAICILLFQVPHEAKVLNHGWRTYWSVS